MSRLIGTHQNAEGVNQWNKVKLFFTNALDACFAFIVKDASKKELKRT
jgi:hypothetical protein